MCRPQSSFWECKNATGKTLAVSSWGSISSSKEELDKLLGDGYHETECGSSSNYACAGKDANFESGKNPEHLQSQFKTMPVIAGAIRVTSANGQYKSNQTTV